MKDVKLLKTGLKIHFPNMKKASETSGGRFNKPEI